MTRRALLIGSAILGLQGCDRDVGLMETRLRERGFTDIRALPTVSATRANIIAGLDWLVKATTAADAAVLYFSGHGHRRLRPDYAAATAAGCSPYYQYLLPADIEQTTAADFRGILAEELTWYQRRLTDRFTGAGLATANVTTILDCCFSGYMARGTVTARPRSPRDDSCTWPLEGIAARLAAVPAEPAIAPTGESNPYAVRVAACQPYQSSFEQPDVTGEVHGVLTRQLSDILNDVGHQRVSWRLIADELRRRVMGVRSEQRPAVEGPDQMIPFTLEEDPYKLSVPVAVDGQDLVIDAAGLLGLDVGDRLRLVAAGSPDVIGDAVVRELQDGRAILDKPASDVVGAPLGVTAVPLTTHMPRRPVAIAASAASVTEAICAELSASRSLRPANPGEPPFASVTANGTFVVRDSIGARMRTSGFPSDGSGIKACVQLVELLAMSRRLAELRSGDESGSGLGDPVNVELVVLEGTERIVQPLAGAKLMVGTNVSLRLRNTSLAPVYAWVFDIDISGRVSLSTQGHPSGVRLERRGSPEAIYNVWGSGVALQWSDDVPVDPAGPSAAVERTETLLVIAADRPQDLRALTTDNLSATGGVVPLTQLGGTRAGGPTSDLESILGEVNGRARSYSPDASHGLRYSTTRIEFFVVPTGQKC